MGDYVAPAYEPIGPIKSFHAVPRFGHTSDITDIFADDGSLDFSQLLDYALGSIFIAAFLLASYLLFIVTVAVFKVCFGKSAGILAGHAFIEDKSIIFEKPKKNSYFRGFVLFLTAAILSGGFIFLIKGTQTVRYVAADVWDGTKGFSILSQKLVDTADLMIDFGNSSMALRDNLIDVIEENLCDTYSLGDDVNPEHEFDKAALSAVDILESMQNFAKDDLVSIRNAFAVTADSVTRRVGNTTDTVVILGNPAYYAVPTIIIGFILFIGIILAWSDIGPSWYYCVQAWVVLPIFFVLIFVSIVVITVAGAALVANSDLCYGNPSRTPEGFVAHILDVFSITGDTRSAIDYYVVDGCRGEYNQKTAVEELLIQVKEGSITALELQILIKVNQERFENECGGQSGSLDPLLPLLTMVIDAFKDLDEVGESATDLLNCESINSIWVDLAHEAVCTSLPGAFAWMFSSITGVYVAGMLTYLLRGALLPSKDVKDVHSVYHDDVDSDSGSESYSEDELI